MYGIDMSGWGGLASGAADFAGTASPMFDFASSVAPITELPAGALSSVAGTLAEDGANAASSMLPGLAGTSVADSIAKNLANGPALSPAAQLIAGNSTWQPEAPGMLDNLKGYGGKALDFFNTNAKSLEAGGKLAGGLGGLYYQNQMAGLAKQQLNDSRANTAYNRARQATGDANLQSASDRVFGKYNG